MISLALTAKVSAACWSERLGYPCCSYSTEVLERDSDGSWSIENGNWCGIDYNSVNSNCWSSKLGYPCCKSTTTVVETDQDGAWGIENNDWCGI
ncbi:Non-catalytic module family DOC2, partial [Piromyces sp. E2]